MQNNANREEKRVVEKWDWEDGWGKPSKIKRLARKKRRKILKRELNAELHRSSV